jgi:hypothetical protein
MTRSRWLVASGVLLAGCSFGDNRPPVAGDDEPPPPDAAPPIEVDAAPAPDATPPFPFARCEGAPHPLPALIEDESVYDQEPFDEVWTIELEIEDTAGFELINTGLVDAEVPVMFEEGSFVASDATIRIRGGMSRHNAQKNYKIEFHDGSRWKGQ